MKKLIVANWKMYVTRLEDADALFELARRGTKEQISQATYDLVLCPPFPYLFEARRLGVPVHLGAQDVSQDTKGAHTSEVSPLLLKDAGIEYVIIGHSERRAQGETDETINRKMRTALQAGLHPILCVGEPSNIRSQGREATQTFIYNQLKKACDGIDTSKQEAGNLAIAYEPLWAISVNGKGASDKPEDTVVITSFIRELLKAKPYGLNPRILYGGSVRSTNIRTFLDHHEIDGALIGKASTEPKEFELILKELAK